MVVFDTDAISDLLKPRPAPDLLRQVASLPVHEQATTAVTIGEIAYGAYLKGDPTLLTRALNLLTGVRIFPFDRPAAVRYGQLRVQLKQLGIVVAERDLMIGAIALDRGLPVLTGNVAHLGQIPGLHVLTWAR